jgi:hypothetical protein
MQRLTTWQTQTGNITMWMNELSNIWVCNSFAVLRHTGRIVSTTQNRKIKIQKSEGGKK